MGLNQSAGYVAVGLASALGAWHFDQWGQVNRVLYIAFGLALLALAVALFFLPETRPWAQLEANQSQVPTAEQEGGIFWKTTFSHPKLRGITWAGVTNNANDGILWAVLPTVLLSAGGTATHLGVLTGIHAASWGLGQLFTGPLSNTGSLRPLIFWGMLLQAAGLWSLHAFLTAWWPYLLIGLGTALVYPTLLVGVSNYSHPSWRPKALATYRFWRDMGYVVGGLVGFAAVQWGHPWWAFSAVAFLTAYAGISFHRFGISHPTD